jgi:hypothetical protein
LVETFNEVVRKLKSGGIIDSMRSKYLKNVPVKISSSRSMLKLGQLVGIFEVFGCGLMIASLVFVGELIGKSLRKVFEKLSSGLRQLN